MQSVFSLYVLVTQHWERVHSHLTLVLAVDALMSNPEGKTTVSKVWWNNDVVRLQRELHQYCELTDNRAAVIMFVVMPSPINIITFFAFCEILVSRTVQLA